MCRRRSAASLASTHRRRRSDAKEAVGRRVDAKESRSPFERPRRTLERHSLRSPEMRKPRGSFDESPPSRGPHVPPSRTRRSYLCRTPALFRRSLPSPPVTGGLPSARRLWVSLAQRDDPKVPGRLDPFGPSRRDCGSSLASRSARPIESFLSFVRCFEVSLQARRQCRPRATARDPFLLPKFREWLVTFRESPMVFREGAKSNQRLAKSNVVESLTSHIATGYVRIA